MIQNEYKQEQEPTEMGTAKKCYLAKEQSTRLKGTECVAYFAAASRPLPSAALSVSYRPTSRLPFHEVLQLSRRNLVSIIIFVAKTPVATKVVIDLSPQLPALQGFHDQGTYGGRTKHFSARAGAGLLAFARAHVMDLQGEGGRGLITCGKRRGQGSCSYLSFLILTTRPTQNHRCTWLGIPTLSHKSPS